MKVTWLTARERQKAGLDPTSGQANGLAHTLTAPGLDFNICASSTHDRIPPSPNTQPGLVVHSTVDKMPTRFSKTRKA